LIFQAISKKISIFPGKLKKIRFFNADFGKFQFFQAIKKNFDFYRQISEKFRFDFFRQKLAIYSYFLANYSISLQKSPLSNILLVHDKI